MSLVLKITANGKSYKIDFFNQFSIGLKYDAIASTFGFSMYYDPNNEDHKAILGVTKYNKVEIEYNNKLILTGTITNHRFKSNSTNNLVVISGYSLPGVLEDSNIPLELYPLQFDKLTLSEIADKLIAPFGLSKSIDPSVQTEMNQKFDVSTASETSSIKEYLTSLCVQKDIIMTSDELGRLVFSKVEPRQIAFKFFDATNGVPDGYEFELEANGRDVFSETTMQKQASISGGNAGESTKTNAFVSDGVFRPKVKTQTSGDDNDTPKACERAVCNQMKSFSLRISTDIWEVDGVLWSPNTIISVHNPWLNLHQPTAFFVQEVTFSNDPEKKSVEIGCVLPGAYDFQQIINIFE